MRATAPLRSNRLDEGLQREHRTREKHNYKHSVHAALLFVRPGERPASEPVLQDCVLEAGQSRAVNSYQDRGEVLVNQRHRLNP